MYFVETFTVNEYCHIIVNMIPVWCYSSRNMSNTCNSIKWRDAKTLFKYKISNYFSKRDTPGTAYYTFYRCKVECSADRVLRDECIWNNNINVPVKCILCVEYNANRRFCLRKVVLPDELDFLKQTFSRPKSIPNSHINIISFNGLLKMIAAQTLSLSSVNYELYIH